MLESFNVSGSLLFVKHSLIQFVGLGKQNLLSFRIFIGILIADVLFEGLRNVLERKSFVNLKLFLDFKK